MSAYNPHNINKGSGQNVHPSPQVSFYQSVLSKRIYFVYPITPKCGVSQAEVDHLDTSALAADEYAE